MSEPTERDRELFAKELRINKEPELAEMVVAGEANGVVSLAALRAIAAAREDGRLEAGRDAVRYRYVRDELSPEDFATIPAEELDAFIDSEMERAGK